ncbi:hypothetical protein [Oricola thermophila]|uniref:Uncharacterized protein n=1 Tax=Oricola thermophila TaxID=2742145 RepID=A0A6N1VIR0_9HYPH|nr:hypothetical protein [Oricola thermophila]QKV19615.1 hypothetical protein HTY61_14720 [Oricola thermophila]
MNITHYSIAGITASVAAVAGVFLQVLVSRPDTEVPVKVEEPAPETGVKLPQIAVPIYSQSEKVGYCVMGIEYGGGDVRQEDSELVVPRVTNDLYIEFGAALPEGVDPRRHCADRAGLRTDMFIIEKARFYEKIAGENEDDN